MQDFATRTSAEILREGLDAARVGNLTLAQELFFQVTKQTPNDELCWICLAAVSSTPIARMTYLERAILINPGSSRAQEMLTVARKQLSDAIVQLATEKLLAGNRAEAESLLLGVTQFDRTNEDAWVGLSSLIDAREEREVLLRLALELNPASSQLQSLLHALDEQVPAARLEIEETPVAALVQEDKNVSPAENLGPATEAPPPETVIVEPIRVETVLALEEPGETESLLSNSTDPQPSADLEEGLKILSTSAADKSPAESVADDRAQFPEISTTQRPEPTNPQGHARSVADASATPRRSNGKVVLVIDDSATVRTTVSLTLERQGYQVVTAMDGSDGLNKLEETSIDLVLLDVMMPNLDGYQVCRTIRNKDKNLPIVMLTGKDGLFDKMRAKMTGSTAYMTKPFEQEELVNTVQQYCFADQLKGDS